MKTADAVKAIQDEFSLDRTVAERIVEKASKGKEFGWTFLEITSSTRTSMC